MTEKTKDGYCLSILQKSGTRFLETGYRRGRGVLAPWGAVAKYSILASIIFKGNFMGQKPQSPFSRFFQRNFFLESGRASLGELNPLR